MHIDIEKLRDFSWELDAQAVLSDVRGLANVYEDEDAEYELADAFIGDYVNGVANYKSYFESGMDARVLMELRKSAVFPFTDKLNEFYALHDLCKTVQDIKDTRVRFLSPHFAQYEDMPWQYYMVLCYFRGNMGDFVFDYEWCFADRDMRKQTTLDQYCRDFVKAHAPVWG